MAREKFHLSLQVRWIQQLRTFEQRRLEFVTGGSERQPVDWVYRVHLPSAPRQKLPARRPECSTAEALAGGHAVRWYRPNARIRSHAASADPNMRHSFAHDFDDDPARGDFDVDLDTQPGIRIQFSVDDGDIWLSANSAGWLHLARICAEMGLHSNFRAGYHFHRTLDWKDSPGTQHEVSFELADDGQPA
jgi:hypothetical protein